METITEAVKYMCFDSFQRLFILLSTGSFVYWALKRGILKIVTREDLKKAAVGEDNELQSSEKKDLLKMEMAGIAFSGLMSLIALDSVKGIETTWKVILYIVLTMICTFTIYDLDRKTLNEFVQKIIGTFKK